MKIAYITYAGIGKYATANGFNEYHDMVPFLRQKGLDIHEEVWDDPAVEWDKYQIALIKTPWDYHEKIDAFKSWLDKLEALQVRLLNDFNLVRWNLDKHYLKEIAGAGLPVIPSLFLSGGWTGFAEDLFAELKSDRLIIKPCISAGAKNTVTVDKNDPDAGFEQIRRLLMDGDYIAQPMMDEVRDGEWSHLFFNGIHSHSILKKPKAGDFRVQQIHGGSILPVEPTQQQIADAQLYVDRFAGGSLYARVDGLMKDTRFLLMELELIEPFLYLSYGEGAPEKYYQALARAIG